MKCGWPGIKEIFGPVISIITFKDEDDLIKQPTLRSMTLSWTVTRDITRAHRFAKEIHADDLEITTTHVTRLRLWWI